MSLFGRLKTVTEEACNRLWARPGERIYVGWHGDADKPDDPCRPLFSWHNPPTGITVELRGFGFGEGLWLSRGGETHEVPLRSDERTNYPVVVASAAPIAYALIYKRDSVVEHGSDFSRLLRILLPPKRASLRDSKIQAVLEASDISQPRWYPLDLESVSGDGQRMILRRGDEVATDFGCRVNIRIFRLNVRTKQWEPIDP